MGNGKKLRMVMIYRKEYAGGSDDDVMSSLNNL